MRNLEKILKNVCVTFFVVIGTLSMCSSLVACSSPKNGNSSLHGVWYVSEVEYEGERYGVLTSGIDLFADKEYPLTYDYLQLVFYENGTVELQSVHFETLTGELIKFEKTGILGGNCEFEFTLGEKKYSGDIYQPLMAEGQMRISETNSGNCGFFKRDAKWGISYQAYLNSLAFGEEYTPSGRWYVQRLSFYNKETGNREHVEVSQMVDYKGAPFTKERYIVDFDAENKRVLLSILDINTNTYIEKEGTFTPYRDKGDWACKGVFSDGTEFSAEKTIQQGVAVQSFLLTYKSEIMYWEYQFGTE